MSAGEPVTISQEEIEQLMKFYNVGTINQLVRAQGYHIEKLQARLHAAERPIPIRQITPREG